MAAGGQSGEWRFLFREDQGVIAAPAWRRGFVILASPIILLTVIWFMLAPYANRGLDERQLLDPLTFVVYFYLVIYAAAILLAAICLYFLSAKRWRDLGAPPSLTGAPLVLGLVWGGAAWLQPRAPDVAPWPLVSGIGLLVVAISVWEIYRLGFGASRSR